MRRAMCAWVPVVAGFLLLTGCVKSRMLLVVKPDASGYIVVTQVTASGGMDGGSHGDEALAGVLEKASEHFGDGVKLAKFERVGSQGFAAVYAFTNVNAVSLPLVAAGPLADMTGGMDGAPAIVRQGIQFALSQTNGTRLAVRMPQALLEAMSAPAESPAAAAAAGEDEEDNRGTREEIAALQVEIAVEVRGQVLSSTASHVNTNRPNRYVLLHMTGDTLSRNPEALKEAMSGPGNMSDMDGFMARLLRMAGATIETNRDVAICFRKEAP